MSASLTWIKDRIMILYYVLVHVTPEQLDKFVEYRPFQGMNYKCPNHSTTASITAAIVQFLITSQSKRNSSEDLQQAYCLSAGTPNVFKILERWLYVYCVHYGVLVEE